MSSEILLGHLLEDGKGFEITFLGNKTVTTTFSNHQARFKDAMHKLKTAYNMVPKGAAIIPENRIQECRGHLVGGILQDSLLPVYGIANDRGLVGYACSIFWVLTEVEIKELKLGIPILPQDLATRDREI